jgi:neutral ceramidase
MHPTCLGHETEVYSADAFGVAETLTEQALAGAGGSNACVTLFNGPEGDISAMWEKQDRRDALNVGTLIADGLLRCLKGGERVDGNIHSVLAISSIRRHEFVDDLRHPRQTARSAEGGAALVAGAEDGRTIYNYDGHVEGTRFTHYRTVDQGAKRDMLEGALPVDLPKAVKELPAKVLGVPKEIPLGVAQVGHLLFATLPGEFTTVMGRRIEAGLHRALPQAKQVLLIGLANDYLSYFTTPEEYDAQQYEGASTLYGPASGPFVQAALSQLARDCALGTKTPFPLRYNYLVGPTETFLPPGQTNSLYNPDDGLGNILQDTTDRLAFRRFPSITWNDSIGPLRAKMKAGQSPVPRVWVEQRQADGSWQTVSVNGHQETNEGIDFVTAVSVWSPQYFTWTAFWMPPTGIDPHGSFRFCALQADGTVTNRMFQLPPNCPMTP